VSEIRHEHVSSYNWKAKYAGLTVSELQRLKTLEEENRRLKQIVAEQALAARHILDKLATEEESVLPIVDDGGRLKIRTSDPSLIRGESRGGSGT
jgi:hypothetical protein